MKSPHRYYFDYAAATPLDQEVLNAMREAELLYGNTSSLHAEGRLARVALDMARARIAQVLAARPDEIVFTSGATESNNLALFGALTALHDPEAEVLTLPTEHASVRQPLRTVREQGMVVTELALRPDGRVDMDDFRARLSDSVALISIALTTSEIGIIQPLREISRFIEDVRVDRVRRGIERPLLFHTDAASAAGLQSLHVSRMGVDLMTIAASKIYGPAGIAALYVRTGTPLAPMFIGGGHELGRRAGSEPVGLAVGFATALTKSESLRKSEVKRLKALRDRLWVGIADIPGIVLNSEMKHSLVNTLNVSFDGRDGEDLVLGLDARGFAVATGAACAESSREPSHVLRALGRSASQAQGSLRISLGRHTQVSDIDALIAAIRAIIAV